jgi:hypothetical protein
MSEELQQFVGTERAAEENRALFIGSIQMLAGAVVKDPYTRGHSDRVTRYSMQVAQEMQLDDEFLEILRISAQLHDGQVGIEDHILKNRSTHAGRIQIMRPTPPRVPTFAPVKQLKECCPAELHHQALMVAVIPMDCRATRSRCWPGSSPSLTLLTH